MKILLAFETNRTRVVAIDSLTSQLGEEIYIIETCDLKTKKVNIRFGNYVQMVSIIKTYKFSVDRKYQERYNMFLRYSQAK